MIGSKGVVGAALVKTLRFVDYEVLCNDVVDENSDSIEKIKEDAEVVFLCLPTPRYENGDVDLSYLHSVLKSLEGYKGIVVVKSTVVPGTCKMFQDKYGFRIVHNPEFLTAANADFDSINPEKLIVGCSDEKDGYTVVNIFDEFKKQGMTVFLTDFETAEMCKYASNIFLAMKVSFANELFDICEKVGADYDEVSESLIIDNRVGHYGFMITPERGWGGMCFPKDLSAFRFFCNEKNLSFLMLDATWLANEKVRKKDE